MLSALGGGLRCGGGGTVARGAQVCGGGYPPLGLLERDTNDSPQSSIRSALGGLESITFWARLVNKLVVTIKAYYQFFTSTRFVVPETDLRFLTLSDTDGHFPVGVGIGYKCIRMYSRGFVAIILCQMDLPPPIMTRHENNP